jgi:hypothetical protein
MRDSSVIATNRPESIVDWLFANVNALNNTLNPELNKTFWKEHMTLSFLQMLQSIRRAKKNRKAISILFRDTFMYIIFTNTDSYYVNFDKI